MTKIPPRPEPLPQLFAAYLNDARQGDHEAGLDVLRLIYSQLKAGSLTLDARVFLLDALRDIIAGNDAEKALFIKKPTHRPRNERATLHHAVAVAERMRRDSLTANDAIDALLGKEYPADRRTLQRAWEAHGTLLRLLIHPDF